MKIWLISGLLIVLMRNLVNGIIVHKVEVGETAILPCPSDDKLHRFQYWQLKSDEIIGPWNNNQKEKFRYEVWSGRLIIRSVSETESGFYKCFSKQILGSELQSETVELLVKKDWEEDFENDSKVSSPFSTGSLHQKNHIDSEKYRDLTTIIYQVNAYRAIIAVLLLLILVMVGIVAFFVRRRRSGTFQELREDSPEELIPSTNSRRIYRSTSVSMSKPLRKTSPDRSLENAVVETDISTSFLLSN